MKMNNIYDINKLIQFRRDIHKHPEIGFKEVRTSEKIIGYLKDIGINESSITRVAKTGIIVDIPGKAIQSGKPFILAFRADIDALPIQEENENLEYQSIHKGVSHMCGHDGHTTALLGGISKILEHIYQIPSDKIVRLIFQPAEEGPGGAFPMIQEGCLNNVNEIYGGHNAPIVEPGYLHIKDGSIMSESTNISIMFYGKGGHAGMSEDSIDPLQIAVDFIIATRALIKEYKQKGIEFTCCMPILHVGQASNIIADKANIEGTLRSFNPSFTTEFKNRLDKLAHSIAKEYNGSAMVDFITKTPALINCSTETRIIERVARKIFGENNVSPLLLPTLGSEDFGYYLQKKPGAFFFIGSKKPGITSIHSSHYDFNDECLDQWSELYLKIAEDRFGLNFDLKNNGV